MLPTRALRLTITVAALLPLLLIMGLSPFASIVGPKTFTAKVFSSLDVAGFDIRES